jgi:hypothetical protein
LRPLVFPSINCSMFLRILGEQFLLFLLRYYFHFFRIISGVAVRRVRLGAENRTLKIIT